MFPFCKPPAHPAAAAALSYLTFPLRKLVLEKKINKDKTIKNTRMFDNPLSGILFQKVWVELWMRREVSA